MPKTPPNNSLAETRSLQQHLASLRALLELQQKQIQAWDERLYSAQPGGVAARRLIGLKNAMKR
ncbi:MAG TPA: hypothetical protein VIL09_06420 [Microvirga sp.]|jgi:hypothetical protein